MSDIEKRLQQHNVGKSRWSKKGIPWRVIHVEEFNSRSEAVRRERQLKSSHSVAFACLKASELSNV